MENKRGERVSEGSLPLSGRKLLQRHLQRLLRHHTAAPRWKLRKKNRRDQESLLDSPSIRLHLKIHLKFGCYYNEAIYSSREEVTRIEAPISRTLLKMGKQPN